MDDNTSSHNMKLDKASGILICTRCGKGPVSAKRGLCEPAAPATADDAVSDDEIEALALEHDGVLWHTPIGGQWRFSKESLSHFARAILALRSGASAQPAEPKAQSNSLRMPDGRCGMCGGDWSVCGCQGMVNREAQKKGGAHDR